MKLLIQQKKTGYNLDDYLLTYLNFDSGLTDDVCENLEWQQVVQNLSLSLSDNSKSGKALSFPEQTNSNKSNKLGGSYLKSENFYLGGQDFSIEAWFYQVKQPPQPSIVRILKSTEDIDNAEAFGVGINTYSNIFRCTSWGDATTSFSYYQSNCDTWYRNKRPSFSNKIWYHSAMCYSHLRRKIYCFLNGKLIDTLNDYYEKTLCYATVGVSTRYTQRSNSAYLDYFIGQIDEVRIYNGLCKYKSDFVLDT